MPIVWDFSRGLSLHHCIGGLGECLRLGDKGCRSSAGGYIGCPEPKGGIEISAIVEQNRELYDAIITDPPYYDAIPYSDLMDFFHIWLRRVAHSVSNRLQDGFVFHNWDRSGIAKTDDGELIDDASRFGGDRTRSKQNYEDGMARAFRTCLGALASQTVVSSWSLPSKQSSRLGDVS